ncbi:hypothetical protein L3Y34_014009 [Caenorhabditis briggsae]|uniref:Uncharacterized protein n=1 Tax=Caenorhabditis briggsae TaxID=6238 RepID=A0AAE9DRN6_CAEBR|nr:hypothetical protein L3Y34_014009 [Caenorhabditis briggsae]
MSKSVSATRRIHPRSFKKDRFAKMLDRIVDHGSENIVEEMKKIETSKALMKNEKCKIHDWLVSFEKSVIFSLPFPALIRKVPHNVDNTPIPIQMHSSDKRGATPCHTTPNSHSKQKNSPRISTWEQ